jgi:beta-galactosidase
VPVKLPKKLAGITTLCFVFNGKIHIKGFVFEKQSRAFDRLAAAENDGLYGDSFTVNGGAVEGIGNNVSILFKDMDFGGTGAGRVALRWRSRQEKNSVQFIFNHNDIDTKIMVELPRAQEYTEGIFDLQTIIKGGGDVKLLFLPGCALDLESVRFIGA